MRRREFITLLGGMVAWPLVARAQQAATPVIGFLSSRSASESESVVSAFRKGLQEIGYTDNQNVQIIYRWAEGQFDRLPALAAEIVERRVSVIAAVGGDAAVDAAKEATTTTPIVFVVGSDPAKTGLVVSLNRPEGNATGVTLFSVVVEQKRLELLRELVPNATRFAVLLNPKIKNRDILRNNTEAAAKKLGQQVHVRIFDASTDGDIEAAFRDIASSKIEAILIGTDPLFSAKRNLIVALTAHYAIPAIYDSRVQVEEGGID